MMVLLSAGEPQAGVAESIWNGALGSTLVVCACVTVRLCPAAVRPPQAGGSLASTLPSRSLCGANPAPRLFMSRVACAPSVPGKFANRLLKLRFSA